MKIVCLTCVYKRLEITILFYKGFAQQQEEAAKQGIDLSLCVVASNDLDANLARRHGHEPFIAPNKPLGAKHNAGLAHAMQEPFDYLMQLGSDDVLCDGFFAFEPLRRALDNRLGMFGLNTLVLFNIAKWEAKRHISLRPFGAGRFISRSLLDRGAYRQRVQWLDSYVGMDYRAHRGQIEWLPQSRVSHTTQAVLDDEPRVMLWDDNVNTGLDYNSESNLIHALGMHEARCHVLPVQWAVMDIKSQQNIHPYTEFKDVRMSELEFETLYGSYAIMQDMEALHMGYGVGGV